jgi:nitrate reductase cytochrome c-type subunit
MNEEAGECLKCHGQIFYQYTNESTGILEKKPMNPYYFIDSTHMAKSVHKSFACTDCHSPEYASFPHAGELRMETAYQCIDCHGGDEHYAKYNFEGIEEEFQKSVHFSHNNERFNCWMCHNPHGYELAAREKSSIREVVSMSNKMCLDCHTDQFKFGRLTNEMPYDLAKVHDWLPNQTVHFEKVRCLECHTKVSDDILVSHNILPKDSAVRACVECHSQNSLLMQSLYAQKVQESRSRTGFFNAAILNDAYVIGANRNWYLNVAIAGLLALSVLGVMVHFILRVLFAKKK